jgi:GT2 family glycosyltransferase
VRSLRDEHPLHVLVAMGDAELVDSPPVGVHVVPLDAEPGALPLAAARNLGARTAIERGADSLVFLDVDCLAGPGLVRAYADVVAAHPDHVWSGPVTYLPPDLTEEQLRRPGDLVDPHPGRPAPLPGEVLHDGEPDLFWSLSFALHRDAWERSGGFCEEYVGYGGEDTDFGHQVTRQGLGLGWVGAARAYHQHHPTSEPPVQHLADLLRNGAIFHRRWGWWPMGGWFEAFEELGLVARDGDGWRAV